MKQIQILDGMLMGDARGELWRVFKPKWWQVWRWWSWWRAGSRGSIALLLSDGKMVHLRTIAAPRSLAPGCAAPDAPVLDVDDPNLD